MILSAVVMIFSTLSALGSLSIMSYLYLTERNAPKFLDSKGQIVLKGILVSVIVTARNEERVIRRCLGSLTKQTYGALEIIVVDDGSSDGTSSIVQELGSSDRRIQLIHAEEKPQGWIGKSWPCQKGFENSKGDLLLFVDADSYFDPRVIELSVNHFESDQYDMFSISPSVNLRGIWSHAVMPLLAGGINLLYPMTKVNDPKSKRAYVFGTFILVRRKVYAAVGGHERVKDSLVEDAAIANLVKSSGFKLRVERDGELAFTDWATGFGDVFHGLERVFSDSIRPYGLVAVLNALHVFFLGLFPLFVVAGYPFLEFLGGGYPFFSLESASFIASILSIAAFAITVARELSLISRKVGKYIFLYPLGVLLFISAIIKTSVKISRGGTFEWKGARYSQKFNSLDQEERTL